MLLKLDEDLKIKNCKTFINKIKGDGLEKVYVGLDLHKSVSLARSFQFREKSRDINFYSGDRVVYSKLASS